MKRRAVAGALIGGLLAVGLYALLGFLLLPWLIERQAPGVVAERLGAELSIGEVRFNPFSLRLQASSLRLSKGAADSSTAGAASAAPAASAEPASSPAGPARAASAEPLLTLERLSVDLDWASLWSRAWSVSDLRLEEPHAHAEIGADGRLDWAALFQPDEPAQESEPLRLLVRHLAVQSGRITVTDLRRPPGLSAQAAGPAPGEAAAASVSVSDVEIEASDLATAPAQGDAQGRYSLAAALPGAGSLHAQGSLVLQPATRSSGTVELKDLSVPALWPLLRRSFGLELEPVADTLSFAARYDGSAAEGTPPALTLDAAELRLTDMALRPSGSDAPLLRLKTVTASGGRLDLAAREIGFTEIALREGALAANVDRDGRLDWQALGGPPANDEQAQAQGTASDDGPWRIRADALRIDALALRATDRSRPMPLAAVAAAIGGSTALAVETGAAATRVQLSDLAARIDALELAAIDGTEPLLALKTLTIAGGAIDTGERRIGIDEVLARGGSASFELAENGPPGLLQALAPADTGRAARTPDPAPADAAPQAAWRHDIRAVRAEGVGLAVRHRGFEPALAYRAEVTTLALGNVSSAADGPMQLDARLGLPEGGRLQARGSIAQSGATADLDVQLDRFALLPLQPLLARQARLKLRSGLLSAKARVELREGRDGAPALSATGSASLDGLRVDEAASGDRFLSWRSMQAQNIAFGTSPSRLSIGEITVQEPGAKVLIARDGSVNLTQVLRTDAGAPKAARASSSEDARTAGKAQAGAPGQRTGRAATKAARAEPQAPAEPPVAVSVERLRLQRGVLDFADLSLVLPFSTRVTALRGNVLGISSAPDRRARVQLGGEIEPFGSARINGSLLPFEPTDFLDLRVRFENVAIPPLSPYTATFAGRTVAEGKLWLDLEYRIENGQLLGRNQIRLADFRLGDRVEARRAIDLPLDLAVALLTDEQGRIDLAVPVRGDVNDPKFDMGALVLEAVGGVLKRIVTAPFRALGRLFGGEGGERFTAVGFRPGSEELAPPQREKLEELARALAQRPALQLVVNGTYAPEQDARALRRREARREVARALGENVAPDASPGPVAFESERTQAVLEALLVRHAGESALKDLRSSPPQAGQAASPAPETVAPPAPAPAPASTAGERGPAPAPGDLHRAMFDRIAQSLTLPDAALQQLAARRAGQVRDYLTGKAGTPSGQVKIGGIESVKVDGDREVNTKLALDAAAAPSPQAAASSPAAAPAGPAAGSR
jgi:hypothetical protein